MNTLNAFKIIEYKIVTRIKKIQSKIFTSDFEEGILIKKAKGIANKTLATLEPTILPMVIPSYPLSAELTEIASSGAEVPNATRVKAIIKGCTLNFLAKEVAPSTSQSPLKYNNIIPITKSNSPIKT